MKEKFTRLFDNERGVSPVIGVILMVAITVILAAVIGFFVLDLGSDTQSVPQASFTVDDDGNIVHDGGDTLDAGNLAYVDGGSETSATSGSLSDGDEVSAGTQIGTVSDDGTVRVVWNDGSGNSATLANIDYSV